MVTTHQDTLILILRWSISILLGMVSWAHLATLNVLNMKMMWVTCWPSQSQDFNLFEYIREILSPHVCAPHHHRHHLTLNLLENGVSLLLFPHFMKGCQLTVCLWKTRFYPPFCPFLPFCCFNDLSVVVMCWSKSQNHNKDRNSDISSSNKRITFYHLKNKKTWIECEKKSDALNLVKWWWCLVDYSFSLVISLSAGHL